MLQSPLKIWCMHKQVIQIYHTTAMEDASQHLLHQVFKGGRGIANAEWYYLKLIQSLANDKHCLRLSQFYLPVPTLEIDGAEPT